MLTKKLTREYNNFIENLFFLTEQNHINFFKASNLRKKNISQIVELENTKPKQDPSISNYDYADFLDDFNQLYDQIEYQDKSLWLPSNANFIYLMSLYENFLSQTIKLLIKHDKHIQEKYMQKYQGDAEELNKKGNRGLIKDIRNTQKCIENIDLLTIPQYKKYINHLLGLHHKDPIYLKYNNYYIEARERSNLFKHRGTEIDDKFEKSLTENLASEGDKNNKYSKKLIKFARTFSRPLRKKWIGGKKGCEHIRDKKSGCLNCSAKFKTPIGRDLSVNPSYFEHSASTIFFLSSVIYRTAFNIANKNSNDQPNLGKEHDFMCKMGMDFNRLIGYIIPLQINTYSRNHLQFQPDDVENVNYFLCQNKILETRLDLKLKIAKIKDTTKVNEEISVMTKNRDHFFQNINDNNIKDILTSYIKKNYEDYLSLGLKVAKRKTLLADWFMTKDLLKSTKFKKLFKQLNNS